MPLDGPLACVGSLAIAQSAKGKVIAIRPEDGSVAWKVNAGDALLAPPAAVEGKVLLASKSNRIELLDAATGERRSSFAAKTWLIDVAVVPADHGGWVVCADLRGCVTFLRPADLTVARQVKLDARLCPGMVFVSSVPTRWGASSGPIAEEAPAVLVPDARGFLYALSLPGREQGGNR
jgi:hypothetical protein